MKYKLYNYITVFTLLFFTVTFSQSFEKKIEENFQTNKNVQIAINASYTGINVTTWSKNEVQVIAILQVEGTTKSDAEKYFKDWEFEALGNSKKVKVSSNCSDNASFKNDFVFFDTLNFDFKVPEIDFSDMECIALSNMDFNFDFDFEDLDDLSDRMEENERYEFIWKDDEHNIKIHSKEEWEAFKKTKDYEVLKRKMKIDKDKIRKEIAKSKEDIKLRIKDIDFSNYKVQVKEALEKAKKELKKINFHINSDAKNININGKKVKITKRIEIKVPKNATFNLNTRHCKVKLPNTIAFGSVKYGSFNANNLNGGKLTIDYAPVKINDVNSCTLFLNNVTDAKITSVTNTNMHSNSSGVFVNRVNRNVTMSDKFGELKINSFHPNFGVFHLNLSQSNATIILDEVSCDFMYDIRRVKIDSSGKTTSTKQKKSSENLCKISGAYSNVIIK